MKALSLYQPWATPVVAGFKRLETRSWRTDYTGRLLIHAAKAWTSAQRELCGTAPFFEALAKLYPAVEAGRPCRRFDAGSY